MRPVRTLPRRLGALAALALSLASVSPPSRAFAADPTEAELAAARQLFKDGKALETKNEWSQALEKFKKVADVKMTPQVRFHIALCQEHLGRLVEAINGFELAYEDARKAGSGAEDVAANAPERANALRVRVPKLRIEVEGKLVSSRVLLDGAPVAPALLGTEIPVDPGPHKVQVESDGRVTQTEEVTLEERGEDEVTLIVDDTPKAAKPPAKKVLPPPEESGSRLPAYIVGGAGLFALAGAGAFLGLRAKAINDVRATCADDDKRCDPGLQETADQGRTYNTAANILLGVGAAGVAAGGVLFFVLAPEDAKTKVGVAPSAGGLTVVGTF
jgi:tetratricopeptide (TPR) repeat protein